MVIWNIHNNHPPVCQNCFAMDVSSVYNFKFRTHRIAKKYIIIPVGDFLIMAISC